MNRRRFSNLRNTFLASAAILVILAGGASAQQKLGDLVTEGGFDWMIGEWVATTDEGDKVDLVYKWELDKHLVTIHLKWPNYEYRGMIFYKPTEDKIVQIGADNQGGSGKGTWDADGNKAVLKTEHTGADSQTNKIGYAFSKVDADTMKVEAYEVYSSGELADYPNFTAEFKRQKKQAGKKK
ncbi:MAG TPA: hypothetical protein VMW72_09810 [Sedimentisphaerales bacterium]|nr:hypothetical protein [Sedimentisphaerales bacterium]